MGQNRLPAVSGAISHFFDSANGHRLRFNDGQDRLLMKKVSSQAAAWKALVTRSSVRISPAIVPVWLTNALKCPTLGTYSGP